MDPILSSRSLTFSYQNRPVITNLTFDLYPREWIALIGPNGAGKTTLLRLLSGGLIPESGHIDLACLGQKTPLASLSAKTIARHIAMLEQQNDSAIDFSVQQIVSMGRYPHQSFFGGVDSGSDLVFTALERTNLVEYRHRRFCTLSSGEQQRVWIALCLAQDPKVLLLDEPFTHLDIRHQTEILSLLQKLAQEGLSIVVSVHNLQLAACADRVLLLSRTEPPCYGVPSEVLSLPLLSRVFQVDMRDDLRHHVLE